jgi:hypothetical protein
MLCSSGIQWQLAKGALPGAQLAALTDLYTATSGNEWTVSTNWPGGPPGTASGDPCVDHWWGVTCTASGTDVTYVLCFALLHSL